MKKAIVTTTINKPTEAILKYCEIAQAQDWKFFIVGDIKTPHEEYRNLAKTYPEVVYLSPTLQSKSEYLELSDLIGWNCIQRRNFGFIEAYNWGAEILATIDDDNIPKENWGKNVYVNTKQTRTLFDTNNPVFDPLSVTNYPELWHRGYPIELLQKKNEIWEDGEVEREVLIQADLWDGDPDIDAICRITFRPNVTIKTTEFFPGKIAPFNSQNTFLSRKVFPTYFLFPGIGRMDDIWAAYVTQFYHPGTLMFGHATVYQERNKHNLVDDLRAELIGYEYSLDLIEHIMSYEDNFPEKALEAYERYRALFKLTQ